MHRLETLQLAAFSPLWKPLIFTTSEYCCAELVSSEPVYFEAVYRKHAKKGTCTPRNTHAARHTGRLHTPLETCSLQGFCRVPWRGAEVTLTGRKARTGTSPLWGTYLHLETRHWFPGHDPSMNHLPPPGEPLGWRAEDRIQRREGLVEGLSVNRWTDNESLWAANILSLAAS